MFTPAAPTAAVLAHGTCLSGSKRIRRHAHLTIVSHRATPGKRACGPPAPAVDSTLDSTMRGGWPTRVRRATGHTRREGIGRIMFRFLTAGESHGPALIAIIEGIPSGLPISRATIDEQLRRRQGGYGRGGRMKIERDAAEPLSGIRHGHTLGSPITLRIENKDWANWRERMSADPIDEPPEAVTRVRPGHADLTGALKYGHTDVRAVIERASSRETAARVAAGALCRQLLAAFGVMIHSHVLAVGGVGYPPGTQPDPDTADDAFWQRVESSE